MPSKALKLFAIFLFCWLAMGAVFGQSQHVDSVTTDLANKKIIQGIKADSIQRSFNFRADSLEHLYNQKINKLDSAQNHFGSTNILQRSTQKVDSLETNFYQRSDSLKNAFKKKLSKLDSSSALLQQKIDSLTTLKLPSTRFTQRLDSLNNLRKETVAGFEKKLQSIKDQTAAKLKKLDLPPEVNDKVNAITKNMDAVNISNSKLDIPSLGAGDNPLGKISENTNLNVPNMNGNTELPSSAITQKAGDIKITDAGADVKQVAGTQGNISNASGITGQVKEYSKEAEQAAKGNFDDVKNIPKVAEEKATDISGIRDVEKQTGELNKFKEMTGKAQDPEALKKEAAAKAKQAAVNHFAGKEEQLKAAMEKIAKYKQKYSSLNGVKELSKKRPNQMRDKPLIERIVPGVAMQFQKRGEDLLVDFNPYAGYRFTGRIKAGVGWNQRIAYSFDGRRFNASARVFGPRVFGEYKLGKGFSPRVEGEVMNTGIPPLLTTTYDPSHREWVWGVFVGLKKEYKLVKNVKGTAMIMTRLFNPEHKSPYAEILNVRMGFEIPMKKKPNVVKK